MPELSHDAPEEGFHEIQLSGKQIVFLFMVLTVASAVIFLSGVLVGRGVRAQRSEPVDASTAATQAPPPVPPAGAAEPSAPPAEPPAPAAETPDELSYHRRLQGEKAGQESVKPEPRPEPEKKPVQSPPPATPAAAPDLSSGGRPGGWLVQVGAFGNAAAARDVVTKLSSKGYPAFLVNPAPGMPVIYRVQVGGYASRSEADQVARRIEKEDQFRPVVRQNR